MSPENVEALPWSEPPQRTEEKRDRPQVRTARSSVLVVEDDPTHRELLVEMLTLWGYDAVPVGSAEEAEFAVKSRPVEAAVVDVFLPGKSGASLMSKLRARFPDAVLIGVSALGDAATARKCKGLGADLFLNKPVGPDELARALQSKHQSWH